MKRRSESRNSLRHHQHCQLNMEFSKSFQQIKAYAQYMGLPVIPIQGKNVSILSDPNSFYKLILDKVRTSERRLALCALYLGTGSKEKALVETICNRLKSKPNFKVQIALDAHRGRRTDSNGNSSLTMLDEIIQDPKLTIDLIDASSRGFIFNMLFGRLQKLNEIGSTFHSKALVFDNDVLLTGANLSSIYFEQRQDRYMFIEDAKLLGDYIGSLMCALGEKDKTLAEAVRLNNLRFLTDHQGDLDVKNRLHDCFIIPMCHQGSAGLTDKEDFLNLINSTISRDTTVYMSSGYFNPSPTIESLKVDSVLVPSEDANGFYGGGGLLRYVPRLYTAIHKNYLGSHPQCELRKYHRPGWSFHAKGIWYENPKSDVYVHVFGSSNYNYRSSHRDFETQFVLVTTNEELKNKLCKEREQLWSESKPFQSEGFKGLSIIYNTFGRLLKGFL